MSWNPTSRNPGETWGTPFFSRHHAPVKLGLVEINDADIFHRHHSRRDAGATQLRRYHCLVDRVTGGGRSQVWL